MLRAAVLIACLACTACGQSATHNASTHTASTPTASTRTAAGGQTWVPPANGATVFAHNCQSCHTLIGNESAHKQGGDLLGYKMSRAQILTQTREMPTRPLTAGELNAVVDYVLHAEQRARHRGT